MKASEYTEETLLLAYALSNCRVMSIPFVLSLISVV